MGNDSTSTRRRFVHLTGVTAAFALAGCSGGGEDGGLPDAYRTATSQGGVKRDPDNLASKSAVNYQSSPKDGEKCKNCRFYIKDKNGDGKGACAVVKGTIDPQGWCSSFSPYQG